jgi:outer membrane lipoprotein-sorting protein
LSPPWIRADEEAVRYLDAIEKKYSELKDYTADVNVHFDMETFKTPDMQAKLYFKAPDKMKVESKGVFFFPREGGYFNPALFKKDDFEIRILEPVAEGKKDIKLKIVPKKKEKMGREFVLLIDRNDNLVREIQTSQFDGRETKAKIEYGRYGSFELPRYILLTLDLPSVEPNEKRGFGPFEQKSERVTGTIEIIYANYKVNTGLKDEIFKPK